MIARRTNENDYVVPPIALLDDYEEAAAVIFGSANTNRTSFGPHLYAKLKIIECRSVVLPVPV